MLRSPFSMRSIYKFEQEQRNNYRSQTIEILQGYEYCTRRCGPLSCRNSKFETGNKDSHGEEQKEI